ncbi:CpsD/CapB family tyrosine-protein kinase [bacterium]|nr:CpsD/CapB family tyrosine-protein kinase [bacterium]
MSKIYEALEQATRERVVEMPKTPGFSPAPIENVSFPPTVSSAVSSDLQIQETMVSLYQNIMTMVDNATEKTILFLASRRGEGASTLIRRFAMVLAQHAHRSVLLLDADQSAPSHLRSFGISPEHGWEEVVKDRLPLESVVYQPSKDYELYVSQVSMNRVSSPSVFDLPELAVFLGEVKQHFNVVLIDAAPANVTREGLALAAIVDGVVLVVEAEKTRWEVAENVRDRIAKQGGHILGAVLNKRNHPIPGFVYRRL